MKSHAKRRGAAALLAGAALLLSAVAAYAALLLNDPFTRSWSNGWDYPWVPVSGHAADFAVDGNEATANVSGVGSTNQRVINVDPDESFYSALIHDIKFEVKTDKVVSGTSGARDYVFLRLRRDGSSTCEYRVMASATLPLGAQSTRYWYFRALKIVSGTETYLDTGDVSPLDSSGNPVTHAADTYLTIRVQVYDTNPTTIRYRAWPTGSSEPSSWYGTVTDSESCLQDAGFPGFVFRLGSQVDNNPVLFTVDNFLYYDALQ